VPPQKFDVSQLYRPNEDTKPLSSFPPHIRSEIRSSATTTPQAATTANNKHPIAPVTSSVPSINRPTAINTITPAVTPTNRPSTTNKPPFTPITPSVLPVNRQSTTNNVITPSVLPVNRQSTTAHNAITPSAVAPDRSAANRHPNLVSHTSAPVPAPVPEQAGNTDPVATNDVNDDADESFACGSDDDAFFAGLDLDIDLGRPIHFEEPLPLPPAAAQPQPLNDQRHNRGVADQQKQQTRLKLAGPPIQPPPAAPPRVPQDQNQKPAVTLATNANVNQKRPLTPSMGGFHFPPGMAVVRLYLLTF
jgi:hypothetical protein